MTRTIQALMLGLVLMTTSELRAAEPTAAPAATANAAARTRFVVLRKGQSASGIARITDTTSPQRLVFVLIGTGRCKATLTDAGTIGDTLSVSGFLNSAFPTEFAGTATSPASFVQDLLVSGFGVLTMDVSYSATVNPTPLDFAYVVQF
jgi:hypothetical protein